MQISYKVNHQISVQQFKEILQHSTLAERRPFDDLDCLKGMISNSNLIITAWDKEKLIGISRCVTDFHFCCYLSDLAIDIKYQKFGIGKKLQSITQEQLGPKCTIFLLASPAAKDYYKHIGYTHNERCWVLPRNTEIK